MWTHSLVMHVLYAISMFATGGSAGSSDSVFLGEVYSDQVMSLVQVGKAVQHQNGLDETAPLKRHPDDDIGVPGKPIGESRELREAGDRRNISVTREFEVVQTAMQSQVSGDATSDVVLGMTILAVTLVLVAAMCLYVDKDDDMSAAKRQARKPLRGGGIRSGGERPVRSRPVPASLENRIGGASGSGYVPGGSPPMGPAGEQPSVRAGGSFDAQHQSPLPQQSMGAVSPPMMPQQASPPQQQVLPQAQRVLGQMPGQMPGQMLPQQGQLAGQGWERASIGSSMASFRSMSGLHNTTGPGATKRPPALCAALVLPHCEAWFAVSWDMIARAAENFEFFGLSGKPLLRASVEGPPGNRKVGISMTPTRSPTLGSCVGGHGAPLEVRCADPKKVYGELRKGRSAGMYSLIYQPTGEEVLAMNFEAAPSFQMTLKAADGSQIAAASRCVESDFSSGIEHLEVRVNPGVDAVLVLCCVLGYILVEGEEMPVGRSLGGSGPSV